MASSSPWQIALESNSNDWHAIASLASNSSLEKNWESILQEAGGKENVAQFLIIDILDNPAASDERKSQSVRCIGNFSSVVPGISRVFCMPEFNLAKHLCDLLEKSPNAITKGHALFCMGSLVDQCPEFGTALVGTSDNTLGLRICDAFSQDNDGKGHAIFALRIMVARIDGFGKELHLQISDLPNKLVLLLEDPNDIIKGHAARAISVMVSSVPGFAQIMLVACPTLASKLALLLNPSVRESCRGDVALLIAHLAERVSGFGKALLTSESNLAPTLADLGTSPSLKDVTKQSTMLAIANLIESVRGFGVIIAAADPQIGTKICELIDKSPSETTKRNAVLAMSNLVTTTHTLEKQFLAQLWPTYSSRFLSLLSPPLTDAGIIGTCKIISWMMTNDQASSESLLACDPYLGDKFVLAIKMGPSEASRSFVVKCLGNFSVGSPKMVRSLLDMNPELASMIPQLLIDTSKQSVKLNAAVGLGSLISNLPRGEEYFFPSNGNQQLLSRVTQQISDLFAASDDVVKSDAVWVIGTLASRVPRFRDAILSLDTGLPTKLCVLMKNQSEAVRSNAARCLGILSANVAFAHAVLAADPDLSSHLCALLSSPSNTACSNALRAIAVIAMVDVAFVAAIAREGTQMTKKLNGLLAGGNDMTKIFCCLAIANLAKQSSSFGELLTSDDPTGLSTKLCALIVTSKNEGVVIQAVQTLASLVKRFPGFGQCCVAASPQLPKRLVDLMDESRDDAKLCTSMGTMLSLVNAVPDFGAMLVGADAALASKLGKWAKCGRRDVEFHASALSVHVAKVPATPLGRSRSLPGTTAATATISITSKGITPSKMLLRRLSNSFGNSSTFAQLAELRTIGKNVIDISQDNWLKYLLDLVFAVEKDTWMDVVDSSGGQDAVAGLLIKILEAEDNIDENSSESNKSSNDDIAGIKMQFTTKLCAVKAVEVLVMKVPAFNHALVTVDDEIAPKLWSLLQSVQSEVRYQDLPIDERNAFIANIMSALAVLLDKMPELIPDMITASPTLGSILCSSSYLSSKTDDIKTGAANLLSIFIEKSPGFGNNLVTTTGNFAAVLTELLTDPSDQVQSAATKIIAHMVGRVPKFGQLLGDLNPNLGSKLSGFLAGDNAECGTGIDARSRSEKQSNAALAIATLAVQVPGFARLMVKEDPFVAKKLCDMLTNGSDDAAAASSVELVKSHAALAVTNLFTCAPGFGSYFMASDFSSLSHSLCELLTSPSDEAKGNAAGVISCLVYVLPSFSEMLLKNDANLGWKLFRILNNCSDYGVTANVLRALASLLYKLPSFGEKLYTADSTVGTKLCSLVESEDIKVRCYSIRAIGCMVLHYPQFGKALLTDCQKLATLLSGYLSIGGDYKLKHEVICTLAWLLDNSPAQYGAALHEVDKNFAEKLCHLLKNGEDDAIKANTLRIIIAMVNFVASFKADLLNCFPDLQARLEVTKTSQYPGLAHYSAVALKVLDSEKKQPPPPLPQPQQNQEQQNQQQQNQQQQNQQQPQGLHVAVEPKANLEGHPCSPINELDDPMYFSCRVVEDVKEEPISITLEPIYGLEKLQIVSLEESVEKLKDLVPDIAKLVEISKFMILKRYPSSNFPYGLTHDQAAAIRLYTTENDVTPEHSLYRKLNSALRSEARKEVTPYFKYIRLLFSALDLLPKWDPSIGIWRGVDGNLLAAYPKDSNFVWWGFSSTTQNLGAVSQFLNKDANGDRTLFNICKATNAVSIKEFSRFEKEDEILLRPGFSFKVQGHTTIAKGLHVVQIIQVDADIDYIS